MGSFVVKFILIWSCVTLLVSCGGQKQSSPRSTPEARKTFGQEEVHGFTATPHFGNTLNAVKTEPPRNNYKALHTPSPAVVGGSTRAALSESDSEKAIESSEIQFVNQSETQRDSLKGSTPKKSVRPTKENSPVPDEVTPPEPASLDLDPASPDPQPEKASLRCENEIIKHCQYTRLVEGFSTSAERGPRNGITRGHTVLPRDLIRNEKSRAAKSPNGTPSFSALSFFEKQIRESNVVCRNSKNEFSMTALQFTNSLNSSCERIVVPARHVLTPEYETPALFPPVHTALIKIPLLSPTRPDSLPANATQPTGIADRSIPPASVARPFVLYIGGYASKEADMESLETQFLHSEFADYFEFKAVPLPTKKYIYNEVLQTSTDFLKKWIRFLNSKSQVILVGHSSGSALAIALSKNIRSQKINVISLDGFVPYELPKRAQSTCWTAEANKLKADSFRFMKSCDAVEVFSFPSCTNSFCLHFSLVNLSSSANQVTNRNYSTTGYARLLPNWIWLEKILYENPR